LGGELGLTGGSDRFFLEMAARLNWGILARGTGLPASGTRTGRAARTPEASCNHKSPSTLTVCDADLPEGAAPEAGPAGNWLDDRRNQLEILRRWMKRSFPPRNATVLRGFPSIFPLRDKRLLEFCVSLPTRMKVRNGYNRYLVRQALTRAAPGNPVAHQQDCILAGLLGALQRSTTEGASVSQ